MKLADLAHNSDETRLPVEGDEADMEQKLWRREECKKAREILTEEDR